MNQSFTACFGNYYFIHKLAKDPAWYLQGPSYATHSRGLACQPPQMDEAT
jgi:hypothetical protein